MATARLLVKVRGNGDAFATAANNSLGAGSLEIDRVLSLPAGAAGQGFEIDAAGPATWLRVGVKNLSEDNPWDHAHALLGPGEPFAAAAQGVEAIEPDLDQSWFPDTPPDDAAIGPGIAPSEVCAFDQQTDQGGRALGPGNAWNTGDAFSEFAKARANFGDALADKLGRILIAHLDTGYDPDHITRPARLRTDLQHNFVAGGDPDSAVDQTPPGLEGVRNRGHGTATLALLAGNRLDGASPSWPGFTDYIGGAPLAQVMPVRIADWVVRFSTGTMVQGFDHAVQNGAHVLSMSMGGLSSSALVDAVNLAYDSGLVLVTAGGNNIAGVPMPRSIVFPARYRRVLAACGVMADGRAYADLEPKTMQGSYGPASKMTTALGAYTPNTAWAQIGCGNVVDMDGAGTSAATPQIASAVALWLAEHFDALAAYPEPWMRVEAVRRALFASAAKTTAMMGAPATFERIGQGVLKVFSALKIQPVPAAQLQKLPPAQDSWSWLDMLTGGGVSIAAGEGGLAAQRGAMLALELTQMEQTTPEVAAAIADPDLPAYQVGGVARRRYFEAALDHGNPSRPLRAFLERQLDRPVLVPVAAAPQPAAPPPARWVRKTPPFPNRRLRVYALDPSAAKSLDYVAVNTTTLSLAWEDLQPGPIGKYLEVIDVDPASGKLYEPVDLNAPQLLAQDGWAPSEGNPGFHQQMVYAVGMTTIDHFERALGRRALWAPRSVKRPGKDGTVKETAYEVPRLRIYPHALRTDNAYYSPDKKALLFGYFPASSTKDAATAPGSLVFACLSSDIVAHEMSHALLDGLHRHFQEISNLDVPAFHEAFADIVALFQHFTVENLVRFEIARAHGQLSLATLLGGLARQFGEGIGRSGPLRDYLGADIAGLDYSSTSEMHERGSILVLAVYEAFLRIVERRTADLIRIATLGTGILPQGALHPDLVDRLTREACKAAEHVLHMCIRALDYCPAVDITFGEYLRALITADRDLVPADPLNYRVAFIESFRKRGILPRDVRTVSDESLAWGTLDDPNPKWFKRVFDGLNLGWDRQLERSEVHALSEANRWKVFDRLKDEFARAAKNGEAPQLCKDLGLAPDVPRYTDLGQPDRRPGDGPTMFSVLGVRPARRISPVDGSFRTEVVVTIQQRQALPLDPDNPESGFFWFRGGSTLIVDTRGSPGVPPGVRYSIVKNSCSTSRQERQRKTVMGGIYSPQRALYFSKAVGEPFALMHTDEGAADHG